MTQAFGYPFMYSLGMNTPPASIFLVGMNVPANTDATSLKAFNDGYTNTHVPEVMAAGGYARATRFERYQAFAHPDARLPAVLPASG